MSPLIVSRISGDSEECDVWALDFDYDIHFKFLNGDSEDTSNSPGINSWAIMVKPPPFQKPFQSIHVVLFHVHDVSLLPGWRWRHDKSH